MKCLLLISLLLGGGCMVGPHYQPPENSLSDAWTTAPEEISTTPPPTDWWALFGDPLLDRVIALAALHNYDLLVAEANILQARALRQVAASTLFPQIDSNLNGTKTYFSENGPVFSGSSLTQGTSTNTGLPFQIQTPQIQPLYNALIDAAWEIDLFGKTRRQVEAAEATVGSVIEQRNDLLITLLAEVARNYIELRSQQKRATLIEERIALTLAQERLAEERLSSGYTDLLDFETIEADLSSARAELPEAIAGVYRALYSLSVLTGRVPEALAEELLPMGALPTPPQQIAIGLRSDLLRRRPDIRMAERNLASATAEVGVAIASFYPSVILGADLGFQALQIKKLFSSNSVTWNYGGNINIPIFQGGRLVGNLKASEAAANAAAYSYQQTVLTALEEAESGIVAYTEELKRRGALTSATAHFRTIAELSGKRYAKGLIDRLDKLESEKTLVSSELRLLESDTSALLYLIALYKALGGGWEPEPEES